MIKLLPSHLRPVDATAMQGKHLPINARKFYEPEATEVKKVRLSVVIAFRVTRPTRHRHPHKPPNISAVIESMRSRIHSVCHAKCHLYFVVSQSSPRAGFTPSYLKISVFTSFSYNQFSNSRYSVLEIMW